MTSEQTQSGKLVVISGPSGVGKSTVCKAVVERTGAELNISMTTRPPGKGEINGNNYWFVSREEFKQKINNGEFLEYAEVFGEYYGTPLDAVQAALDQGRTIILEIDVQGGHQVKKQLPEALMIFLLPPKHEDLEERIDGRGRGENEATRSLRLDTASQEIAAAWHDYDHMVINDDLEQAINEVINIIQGKSGEPND